MKPKIKPNKACVCKSTIAEIAASQKAIDPSKTPAKAYVKGQGT